MSGHVGKLVAGFILMGVCFWTTYRAAGPREEPPPAPPLTAVLYMSCDQLVAAAITTPDGQLLAFDGGTGVPIQDVLALANTAVKKARVDAPCERQVGT